MKLNFFLFLVSQTQLIEAMLRMLWTREAKSKTALEPSSTSKPIDLTSETNPHDNTVKSFKKPRIEGDKRLDWCLAFGWHCGLPAATAFCRWKGYYYANDYAMDAFVHNTKTIGTGVLCKSPFCSGFKYIECSFQN